MRSGPSRVEAFKRKCGKFARNEQAIGGIPAGIINIATVMILITMVPMLLVPMESSSTTQIGAYATMFADSDTNNTSALEARIADWNTSYGGVIDNNRNAYGTISGITNIQAVVLILAVVLAIAM